MIRASAVVFVSLVASPLLAQTATIQGRVHDEVTSAPVAGARVQLVGTSREVRSDSLGRYSFDQVRLGRVTLVIDAPGYAILRQVLELDHAGTVILPVAITPVALVLDQLRVTSPGSERSGIVKGEDLPPGEAGGVGNALAARVPGARVLFHGGSVGQATRLLLRGVKSLMLSGEPLYYVDGVRVSPPSAPARNRVGEPSILDLIDPATIERIEVLAGPAASATYGLGANNGVVLIYTKR